MNMHTGARPYKCAHCDMAFADMSSCYKHRKAHSLKSNIRSAVNNAPDSVATSTHSPATNNMTNAPRHSVSIVDCPNLRANSIISAADVQMVLTAGKEHIIDGACITPATSDEISQLDKIVYETLLPNDLRVLSDETSASIDSSGVFKHHQSPDQSTQLKLVLTQGMTPDVPDAPSGFSHPDLTTVFIQELCNKSIDASGILPQERFTQVSASLCGAVVATGTTKAETTTDDVVAAVKLEDVISTDATNNVIIRRQPQPLCDTNESVGCASGVVNITESVRVDDGVALTPVQLVGLESTQQYYLILSGSEQE